MFERTVCVFHCFLDSVITKNLIPHEGRNLIDDQEDQYKHERKINFRW